ncbi:MAG: hypothetical protein ACK4PM_15210 [Acinetobacter junii]
MGIFFFGQTKLEFFSFSGGVSNLMLANFLKILTEKIPVFSIPPRMPIYLKIYAAYFLGGVLKSMLTLNEAIIDVKEG